MRLKSVASAIACGLAIAITLSPAVSSAASVNLKKKFNVDWDEVLGGSGIQPTKKGNQGTGIPFAFKGRFVYIEDGSITIKFKDGGIENPKGKLIFYTLLNTGFGTPNAAEGNIRFKNDLGEEVSFIFVGDKNIRDYNPGPFTNNLSPRAKPPALEWYVNDEGRRLDAQILALPKSWKGTRVVSLTVTATGPGMDALWLSAISYFAEPVH